MLAGTDESDSFVDADGTWIVRENLEPNFVQSELIERFLDNEPGGFGTETVSLHI